MQNFDVGQVAAETDGDLVILEPHAPQHRHERLCGTPLRLFDDVELTDMALDAVSTLTGEISNLRIRIAGTCQVDELSCVATTCGSGSVRTIPPSAVRSTLASLKEEKSM